MDALRIVTVANPAAGVDFTYTHPATVVSLVRCLRIKFQHGVGAGNRNIVLSLFDPGGLLMSSIYFTGAVSLADTFNFFALKSEQDAFQYVFGWFLGGYISQAECPYWPMLTGWQLRSQVQGFQADDQISDVRILFEDIGLEAIGAVA